MAKKKMNDAAASDELPPADEPPRRGPPARTGGRRGRAGGGGEGADPRDADEERDARAVVAAEDDGGGSVPAPTAPNGAAAAGTGFRPKRPAARFARYAPKKKWARSPPPEEVECGDLPPAAKKKKRDVPKEHMTAAAAAAATATATAAATTVLVATKNDDGPSEISPDQEQGHPRLCLPIQKPPTQMVVTGRNDRRRRRTSVLTWDGLPPPAEDRRGAPGEGAGGRDGRDGSDRDRRRRSSSVPTFDPQLRRLSSISIGNLSAVSGWGDPGDGITLSGLSFGGCADGPGFAEGSPATTTKEAVFGRMPGKSPARNPDPARDQTTAKDPDLGKCQTTNGGGAGLVDKTPVPIKERVFGQTHQMMDKSPTKRDGTSTKNPCTRERPMANGRMPGRMVGTSPMARERTRMTNLDPRDRQMASMMGGGATGGGGRGSGAMGQWGMVLQGSSMRNTVDATGRRLSAEQFSMLAGRGGMGGIAPGGGGSGNFLRGKRKRTMDRFAMDQFSTMGGNQMRSMLPPSKKLSDDIEASINAVRSAFLDNEFAARAKEMAGAGRRRKPGASSARASSTGASTRPADGGGRRGDGRASPKSPRREDGGRFEGPRGTSSAAVDLLRRGPAVPEKPKRPFSAYNLFFQLEREYIRHEVTQGRKPREDPMIKNALLRVEGKCEAGGAGDNEKNESAVESVSISIIKDGEFDALNPSPATSRSQLQPSHGDPIPRKDSQHFDDPNIPKRYAHLLMAKHWYSVAHKEKRKHRKTDGSCGFIELTKMVSARWKTIDDTDPHVKRYCQRLADTELGKYKMDQKQYKRLMKKFESEVDRSLKAKVLAAAAVEKGEGNEKTANGVEPTDGRPGKKKCWGPEEGDVDMDQKKKKKLSEDAGAAGSEGRSPISSAQRRQPSPRPSNLDGGAALARRIPEIRARRSGAQSSTTPRGVDFMTPAPPNSPGDLPPPPFVASDSRGRKAGTREEGKESRIFDREALLLQENKHRSRGRDGTARRKVAGSLEALAPSNARGGSTLQSPHGAWTADGSGRDARFGAEEARMWSAARERARMLELAETGDAPTLCNMRSETDAVETRRYMEARRRMQMGLRGEACMSSGPDAAHVGMGMGIASKVCDSQAASRSEMGPKFAAFSAQHQLQMEIKEGAMMGGSGRGMPQGSDVGRRMPTRITQDVARSSSEQFSPYHGKPAFFGKDDPLQQRLVKQFIASTRRENGTISSPVTATGASAVNEEEQFDKEVDQFLSGLGKQIKEKRRRNLTGGADSNLDPTSCVLAAAAAAVDYGGNFGPKETVRGAKAMGVQAARANMMASMMARNASHGNSNWQKYNHPEMLEQMIMRGNMGGGGGVMRRPLRDGSDVRQRHHRQGTANGVGDDEDENPALPGHGW